MTAKSMDVFSLRDTVVSEYQKFATSFTTIHAEDIRQQVDAIYAEGRYWPEPLIQINPSYKQGSGTEALVADGTPTPLGTSSPSSATSAMTDRPSAGIPTAASYCAASSTPRSSTSTDCRATTRTA